MAPRRTIHTLYTLYTRMVTSYRCGVVGAGWDHGDGRGHRGAAVPVYGPLAGWRVEPPVAVYGRPCPLDSSGHTQSPCIPSRECDRVYMWGQFLGNRTRN